MSTSPPHTQHARITPASAHRQPPAAATPRRVPRGTPRVRDPQRRRVAGAAVDKARNNIPTAEIQPCRHPRHRSRRCPGRAHPTGSGRRRGRRRHAREVAEPLTQYLRGLWSPSTATAPTAPAPVPGSYGCHSMRWATAPGIGGRVKPYTVWYRPRSSAMPSRSGFPARCRRRGRHPPGAAAHRSPRAARQVPARDDDAVRGHRKHQFIRRPTRRATGSSAASSKRDGMRPGAGAGPPGRDDDLPRAAVPQSPRASRPTIRTRVLHAPGREFGHGGQVRVAAFGGVAGGVPGGCPAGRAVIRAVTLPIQCRSRPSTGRGRRDRHRLAVGEHPDRARSGPSAGCRNGRPRPRRRRTMAAAANVPIRTDGGTIHPGDNGGSPDTACPASPDAPARGARSSIGHRRVCAQDCPGAGCRRAAAARRSRRSSGGCATAWWQRGMASAPCG